MISAILVLVGFLALCAIGWGVLCFFAAGMSDSVAGSSIWNNNGMVAFACGVGTFIVVICIGLWRWHTGA